MLKHARWHTASIPFSVVASIAIGGLFVVAASPATAWFDADDLDELDGPPAQVRAQVLEASSIKFSTTRGVLDPADPPTTSGVVAFDADDVAVALSTIEIDIPLFYVGADGEIIDEARLRDWLEGRDSPMAPYADELVAAGVEHDVDPRLVVGIAAIESTVGQRLPPGSHNAWGWSGSGAHGLKHWDSWPESIHDFTERFARIYDTDNVDDRMARKYVPPNWEKWLRTVRWVMADI